MNKLPTVDIKGKDYVMVKDRIVEFNKLYPDDGSIITEILSPLDSERIVVKATVKFRNSVFTGHSQATIGDGYINKTAALENAETSAVGRALAMMGIGVIDSIASVDEINKAEGSKGKTFKSDNTLKSKKILIKQRLDLLGKEVSPDTIKELTDLDPDPENYDEIISRLNVLVEESVDPTGENPNHDSND